MTVSLDNPQRRVFLCRVGAMAGCAVFAPVITACETTDLYTPAPTHASMDFDVSSATYAALAQVGGSVAVTVGGADGLLIRISQSVVAGVPSTCTHQGGQLFWDAPNSRLECMLHHAKFKSSGEVLAKPQPDNPTIAGLAVWTVAFDAAKGTGKVST